MSKTIVLKNEKNYPIGEVRYIDNGNATGICYRSPTFAGSYIRRIVCVDGVIDNVFEQDNWIIRTR